MISCENMLIDFHEKYGHYISAIPTTKIPENVKILRNDLIQEEVLETRVAIKDNNLIEIADGIADAVYVLVGTAVAYGIPFDRIFKEVHRSNMTKTAVKAKEGEKYGTKTPKGPDYIPPNIEGILSEPGESTQLEKIHEDYIS